MYGKSILTGARELPSIGGNSGSSGPRSYGQSDSAAELAMLQAGNDKVLQQTYQTQEDYGTDLRVLDPIIIRGSKVGSLHDTVVNFDISRASAIRSEEIRRQELFTLGGRYSNADGMTVLGAVTQRNSLPNYASAMGQELVTTVPKAFANTVVDTFEFGTNLYLSRYRPVRARLTTSILAQIRLFWQGFGREAELCFLEEHCLQ